MSERERPPAGQSAENPGEESQRVAVGRPLVARFGGGVGYLHAVCANISSGGMFVKCQSTLPPGARCSFYVELVPGKVSVYGAAEVIWSGVDPSGPGLGVRFLELEEACVQEFRDWLVESARAAEVGIGIDGRDEMEPLSSLELHQRVELEARLQDNVSADVESDIQPTGFETLPHRSDPSRRRSAPNVLRWLPSIGEIGDWRVVTMIVVTLVGLSSYWFSLRVGSSEPVGSSSVGTVTPIEPERPLEDGLASDQSLASSTIEVAPEATESRAAAVRTAVLDWASAWEEQNVSAYLGAYSAGFESEEFESREAWALHRQTRVESPSSIVLSVEELEIEWQEPNLARARFLQLYSSPGYSDRIRKVLTFEWQEEQWKIIAESVESEL